jgi:uncharacterized protein YdeI (YjbR/CyaY-like superfamily)
MAKAMDQYQPIEVPRREQWRNWLAAHHPQAVKIWLVTDQKHCGGKHLGYDAIGEEALCFGWLDSLPRKLDAA